MATCNDPPNVISFKGDHKALMDKINTMTGLVVLDFYVPWCPPCKVIASHLPGIFKQYSNVNFIKINRDENDWLVRQDFKIQSVPCIKFFKNEGGGYREIDSLPAPNPTELKKKMEEYGK